MTGTPAALDDRYGRTPARGARRGRRVLVAAVAVVLLVLGAWIARGVLEDEVQWRDLGYDVLDDARVQVSFQVTQAPGATAVCTVRALNDAFTEVGFLPVTVGPSAERTQRVTVVVGTTAPAVTGALTGCSAAAG